MTSGVVYLICGVKVAERLVASAWSLRKHYDGPVTVLCSTDDEQELLSHAATDLGLDLQCIDLSESPHPAYVAKSHIHDWTPYEDTIFLDADTIITGEIDDLFGHRLTLTPNSNWKTTGKRCRRWLQQWETLDNPWINALVAYQVAAPRPFINIGIFAFQRDNPDLDIWHRLTQRFPEGPLPEQTAMQLLTSVITHRMMDERFNRLLDIGCTTDDIRIWHYHGNRHYGRSDSTLWRQAFDEAFIANIGGIRNWAGLYDKHVKYYLRGHRN
ncbi:hypothetical protein LCGC14_2058540 [marine sediment metagenome]|uniref:Nucleotide-diphospho-sugar transferase domain-containing protein n=1 Tax=marine sediment metagenome TaxID=412755 RepID=A0A0F9HIU6_9ZZZZ